MPTWTSAYRKALREPAQLLGPDVSAQLVQLLLDVSGHLTAEQRRRAGNHGGVCRKQRVRSALREQHSTSGSVLTRVSYDLLPGLVGDDVEQQRRDEGRERPQPHGAVSAAAGHGERTTLVTRQPFTHTQVTM